MLKIINQLSKNVSLNIDQFQELTKDFNPIDLINYKDSKNGDGLILKAARQGNLNLLKIIQNINPKLNFNMTNFDGKNALHESSQNGHYECVRFLINDCNIDVNSIRKGDWYLICLFNFKNSQDFYFFGPP